MIPAINVLPQAMLPATPALVFGPGGGVALLAVAALVVFLVAGTIAESRAPSADEQAGVERRTLPAPLDRAA